MPGQLAGRTEWHNLVAFKRTAEIVRDYVKKGSKLFIEGKLTTRVGTTKSPARSATRPRSWSSTFRCFRSRRRLSVAVTASGKLIEFVG